MSKKTITPEMITMAFYDIMKQNAPVRKFPPGPIGKKGTPFYSPYPGNLRNNGVLCDFFSKDHTRIRVGGPVGYAVYTERSGWQEKSVAEFINLLKSYGGEIR